MIDHNKMWDNPKLYNLNENPSQEAIRKVVYKNVCEKKYTDLDDDNRLRFQLVMSGISSENALETFKNIYPNCKFNEFKFEGVTYTGCWHDNSFYLYSYIQNNEKKVANKSFSCNNHIKLRQILKKYLKGKK